MVTLHSKGQRTNAWKRIKKKKKTQPELLTQPQTYRKSPLVFTFTCRNQNWLHNMLLEEAEAPVQGQVSTVPGTLKEFILNSFSSPLHWTTANLHVLILKTQLCTNYRGSGRNSCPHVDNDAWAHHFLDRLSVAFRNDFSSFCLFFKSLNGPVPKYLSDSINLHQPSKALRSANQMVLDVPPIYIR